MHKCPNCGNTVECLSVEGVMMTGKTSIKVDADTGIIETVAPIVPTVMVKKGFTVDQLPPDKIKAYCPKCSHRDSVPNFKVVRLCYFTGNEGHREVKVKVKGMDLGIFLSDAAVPKDMAVVKLTTDRAILDSMINA